jgi:hypothetical protein
MEPVQFIHKAQSKATARVTPAMEFGIIDHVWTIEEIVALLITIHG